MLINMPNNVNKPIHDLCTQFLDNIQDCCGIVLLIVTQKHTHAKKVTINYFVNNKYNKIIIGHLLDTII